jgi:hypothetical protein
MADPKMSAPGAGFSLPGLCRLQLTSLLKSIKMTSFKQPVPYVIMIEKRLDVIAEGSMCTLSEG